MSLEERVDQLTTLLMVARTDIRKLQAQFDDLVCKKRQRENSQGDCDENQPPVKKKKTAELFLSSDEEEEHDDNEPLTKNENKAEVDSFIGLSSCEESEEEEIEETEAKSKPEVGDIYSTCDGFCVFLGKSNWGWFYQHKDLPEACQKVSLEKVFLASDHDYTNLDYEDSTVKRVTGRTLDRILSRISTKFVYLVDSERVKAIQNPQSGSDVIEMFKEWGCQVNFGSTFTNKEHSENILTEIANRNLHIEKCFYRHNQTYHGMCHACRLNPRWIRYNYKRAPSSISETGTFNVGETCKKRISVLSEVVHAWHKHPRHVFIFKFIEAM